MTRHVDTVDVAGVVFELSCRFPKPGFWARRHPEFLTRRRPDVRVRIEYEEGFRRRAGAGDDTVADAANVRRRGRHLVVSTGYYRALVDVRRGRVVVRIAAGFDVAGLMRTLAALWHLERGSLLLHAACFGPAGAATLACGPAEAAPPRAATAGWLAVTPGADGVGVMPTPFLHGEGPARAKGWRATSLSLPHADGDRAWGAALAVRTLLPFAWQADRRRAAVERTLDLAARIVTTLGCRTDGVPAASHREALVG